ncbi:MAG: NAD-dependent epimerase/dehydratase family protein [Planctomycetota bacterium]
MNRQSFFHPSPPATRATAAAGPEHEERDQCREPVERRERLLVTGSTGYLGHYVTAQLRAAGRSFLELRSAPQSPRLDLRDAAAVRWFLTAARPSTILHLAGFTGRTRRGAAQARDPGAAERETRMFDEVNVEGTRNLLAVAGELGVERVVSIGSAAEYGVRGTAEPVDVQEGVQPTTVYGRSKWRQTEVVWEQAQRWGFSACVLRVFNLFGPQQPLGLVVPDLLARLQAAPNSDATPLMLPAAHDVRDFVPVELVARAIVSLANRPSVSGIQHACSGAGVTILQVANWLAAEYDREQVWRVPDDARRPTFSVGVPSPIMRELAMAEPVPSTFDLPLAWPLPLEQLIRRVARLARQSAPQQR